MSLTADLALVTACRDALDRGHRTIGKVEWDVTDGLEQKVIGDGFRCVAAADTPEDARLIVAAVMALPAALSLIEDTLNRHWPMATTYVEPNGGAEIHRCDDCLDDHPCSEYAPAIAALHTIATSLGVETG